MNIELGWTYKFKFNNDFTLLDDIYTVLRIYTYSELLEDKIDLNTELYAKVGKTKMQFEADVATLRNDKILKVQHPEHQDTILYIPTSILSEAPLFTVKKYGRLMVVLNVGVYPNKEDLDHVKNLLHEELQVMLGFANPPDVLVTRHQWLTDQEYQELKDEREQNKKVVNYFSENIKLQKINSELTAKINAYEKLFKEWIKTKGTEVTVPGS